MIKQLGLGTDTEVHMREHKPWQEAVNTLTATMGLEFVEVVCSGTTWDGFKVVVAPLDNGQIAREELLQKEIPLEFILEVRKLFPVSIPLFVRGLITQQEIDRGIQNVKLQGAFWADDGR